MTVVMMNVQTSTWWRNWKYDICFENENVSQENEIRADFVVDVVQPL